MITHSKPWLSFDDRAAIVATLTTGMLAQGQQVGEFESKIADYLQVAGGVAVSSGTAALILALRAIGVAAGDEVILPTYVCKSVAEAIESVQARPIFCDVGPEWNMTAETVSRRMSRLTSAIIAVHIYGIPADVDALKQFGKPVLEDCCQAFGAREQGRAVGTKGSIGVFSFHATKCLTTGEGGIAVSADPLLLERMRVLRDGFDGAAMRARVASPMTDLQAALGLSQLSRYSNFLSRRCEIADYYFTELQQCPVLLPESIREKSIFFRFPVRVGSHNFDDTKRRFQSLGVQVRRGVDRLLHRAMELAPEDFPMSEKLFAETVSIPIYPALSNTDARVVINACRKIFREMRLERSN
jgi:perosamine synthetase